MAYDEELVERVRAIVAEDALQADNPVDLGERRMFGALAFMVNGNMAVAASGGGGLLVRCGGQERAEALVEEPVATVAIMGSQRMEGWLNVVPEILDDDATLERWVRVGLDVAYSLPPK